MKHVPFAGSSRFAAQSILILSSISVAYAAEVPAPVGEYRVVAMRTASDVATTSSSQEREDWVGQSVEFGESRVTWLDGQNCTIWSVREADSADFFLDDTNLSDVNLAPMDFGSETVDRRLNVPVDLTCNDFGEQVLAHFVIIDQRVLLLSTPSGGTYVILERPLNSGQIAKLQRELKVMKFYDGEANGTLDSATVSSIGYYAEYRGATFRFYRTVITENLLDRLDVLEK